MGAEDADCAEVDRSRQTFTEVDKRQQESLEVNRRPGQASKCQHESTEVSNLDFDEEDLDQVESFGYKHPDWIKKIYRKVVLSTHPDKFVNFPIEHLRRKYLNIYKDAVDAMVELEYSTVLLCAYETDVEITNYEALDFLDAGIHDKQSKMHNIKKFIINDEGPLFVFFIHAFIFYYFE